MAVRIETQGAVATVVIDRPERKKSVLVFTDRFSTTPMPRTNTK